MSTTDSRSRTRAVELPPAGRRLRLAIVGAGDVAHRHYLPGLSSMADEVEVVAIADPRPGAAAAACVAVRAWSPDATAYADAADLLARSSLDALINLTPAPSHEAVSGAALDAGVHVYSEKPLAGTIEEANELIELATQQRRLLLCAPGTAATRHVGWLAQIVASGRFGRLSLAVAQHADSGPATWREYGGDPEVFYGPSVGPVFDHGIYRLHEMVALLGPVAAVQAMGAIGVPRRVVRGGPRVGETLEVTAPDHVLLNLRFARGGLGQLLASFGTAATLAPWLELHFERATISFPGDPYSKDSPASLYVDDDTSLDLAGWTHGLQPPPPIEARPVVETGIAHFVDCLRGARPILTAETARHVLDVILKAYASIADGRSHDTETTI
jgi:predicted dehydrogenase